MAKVKYLGQIIGSGEHFPVPETISTIKNIKVPKTKKALRSLLGLFNVKTHSVPNDIPWSEEAESLFNLLKNSFHLITSHSAADIANPLKIHTVSMTGIGACLLQQD